MGVYSWQYVGNQSKPQTVQLYHGEKSGHVLISLGKTVLVVDFKVRETKKYTFFIEEELCEVQIERRGEKFFYTFEINKTAQTPLNKKRKHLEKKHLFQTLALLGGLFLFVFLVFKIMNKNKATTIKSEYFTGETVARLERNEKGELTYFFIAGDQSYNGKVSVKNKPSFEIPLESGDEFKLKYIPNNPLNHQLKLNEPSQKQIVKYIKKAADIEAANHANQSYERAECLVELGYELEGLSALSKFYFQKTPSSKNEKFNENSYKRLIRGIDFQKKSEKCLVF